MPLKTQKRSLVHLAELTSPIWSSLCSFQRTIYRPQKSIAVQKLKIYGMYCKYCRYYREGEADMCAIYLIQSYAKAFMQNYPTESNILLRISDLVQKANLII